MLLSFVSFGLIYAWLVVHRTRLEQLESRLENEGLAYALAARRAEADPGGPTAEVALPAPVASPAPAPADATALVGGQP